MNDLFEGDLTDQDKLVYVNNVIKGKLLESETLKQQAANNTKEQFANSPDLKTELMNAIIGGSGGPHRDEHAGVGLRNRSQRNQSPASVDVAAGQVHRIIGDAGTATGINAYVGHTALVWTTDSQPGEVYALENGGLRRLTHHNDEVVASLKLAETREVTAKSKDGTEVHGLITLPPGAQAGTKYPMLLFIHGGPNGQDDHGFNLHRQLFAAHGYAELNVNYRGGSGRGNAYQKVIAADWGHHEVDDLLATVDEVVKEGLVDPDRLGVGGWSYGGILTDYTIASTTRFKAASSGAGMGNPVALYGIDEYILQYDNELGSPWKDPQKYIQLGYPFFHADRIRTPTLFMGGDKDFNVPLNGGEQMYQALKSLNVPAELIVYPGQFHGFTRPSFIRDRYQRWFDWYDKWVLGKTPARGEKVAALHVAQGSPSVPHRVRAGEGGGLRGRDRSGLQRRSNHLRSTECQGEEIFGTASAVPERVRRLGRGISGY